LNSLIFIFLLNLSLHHIILTMDLKYYFNLLINPIS